MTMNSVCFINCNISLHMYSCFVDDVDRHRCFNAFLGVGSYLGHLNTTVSGKQCQRWDEDTMHVRNVAYTNPSLFPEGNLSLAENYCRNPDIYRTFWCYTMDPNVRWDSCNIWRCFKNNGTWYCIEKGTNR